MPWGVTFWPLSLRKGSPPGPTTQQTTPAKLDLISWPLSFPPPEPARFPQPNPIVTAPLVPRLLDSPDIFAYKAASDLAQFVSRDILKPVPGPTVQQSVPPLRPLDLTTYALPYVTSELNKLIQGPASLPPLIHKLLEPALYPAGAWPLAATYQVWQGPSAAPTTHVTYPISISIQGAILISL